MECDEDEVRSFWDLVTLCEKLGYVGGRVYCCPALHIAGPNPDHNMFSAIPLDFAYGGYRWWFFVMLSIIAPACREIVDVSIKLLIPSSFLIG